MAVVCRTFSRSSMCIMSDRFLTQNAPRFRDKVLWFCKCSTWNVYKLKKLRKQYKINVKAASTYCAIPDVSRETSGILCVRNEMASCFCARGAFAVYKIVSRETIAAPVSVCASAETVFWILCVICWDVSRETMYRKGIKLAKIYWFCYWVVL